MSIKRNGDQKGAAHDITKEVVDDFDKSLNPDRAVPVLPKVEHDEAPDTNGHDDITGESPTDE